MSRTKIEWTDRTWNPVRGCSITSEGCRNCYAMKQAHRFSGEGKAYEGLTKLGSKGPVWTGDIRIAPSVLDAPLRWRKPCRIFANSMGDLFHPAIDDQTLLVLFSVMASAVALNGHTIQVLTKQAERMHSFVSRLRWIIGMSPLDIQGRKHLLVKVPVFEEHLPETLEHGGTLLDEVGCPEGIWLGVSTENQAAADDRIPPLLKTPAVVRWISAEPLLGPINLREMAHADDFHLDALDTPDPGYKLNWVVVGGESGPGARPMHPDWVRSIRDQCVDAGTPFLFKQWGAWTPYQGKPQISFSSEMPLSPVRTAWPDGSIGPGFVDDNGGCGVSISRVGKKLAGRVLDGITWDQYPEAT